LVGIDANNENRRQAFSLVDKSDIKKQKHLEVKHSRIETNVLINPGRDYELKPNDVCLYISLTKEQNFDFKKVIKHPDVAEAQGQTEASVSHFWFLSSRLILKST
jgi:hypothetical protein